MSQQEIDFIDVIADDDFRAGGKPVKKGALFQCTKKTAKQLVAAGQAHYPSDEERQALADEQADNDPEPTGDEPAGADADNQGEREGGDAAAGEPEPAKPATRSGGRKAAK